MKIKADQEVRRKQVADRESHYLSNIIPKMKEKERFQNQLHMKYKQEKEEKYQNDIMAKSAKESLFKSTHM